jgi:hypothetical protein
MKRKHVVTAITYGTTLLLALVAGLLCECFELPVWQSCMITFALGAAAYSGVTSVLVDLCMGWSVKRELRALDGNDTDRKIQMSFVGRSIVVLIGAFFS